MVVPDAIREPLLGFLCGHAPFARMAAEDLDFIARHARLSYYAPGARIMEMSQAPAAGLYIVHQGYVHCRTAATDTLVLGPGECFPLQGDDLAGDAPAASFDAADDVFCYRLASEHLLELLRRSPVFRTFHTAAPRVLAETSQQASAYGFHERAIEHGSLLAPVSTRIRREPVSCTSDTAIRVALECMSAASVGTIAVVDQQQIPLGIFTLTDLLQRVVLAQRALDQPVCDVMTAAPQCIEETASAQDAMALMAQRGVHQLLITRAGRLSGVISERDLFALQRTSLRTIQQRIRSAQDLAALGVAATELTSLTDILLAQGLGGAILTGVISAQKDALAVRVLDLLAPQFALDRVHWCWLALGSEGRSEQTAGSDQDNALVFDTATLAASELDATRSELLRFAQAANEALAQVGFPLCPGQIMAGNVEYCLSSAEWRARFAQWLREPTPEALLRANIFFDFRPLHGRSSVGLDLRRWLGAHAAGSRLFLELLRANALQCDPPLGMLRSFRTDEDSSPDSVNLKTQGTRIYVDAARVLALARSIPATSTAQRLQQGTRALNLPERDLAGMLQGFEFLQTLRLRAQRGLISAKNVSEPNSINPYALSDPDQRLLKEAYRQARLLQGLLAQAVSD